MDGCGCVRRWVCTNRNVDREVRVYTHTYGGMCAQRHTHTFTHAHVLARTHKCIICTHLRNTHVHPKSLALKSEFVRGAELNLPHSRARAHTHTHIHARLFTHSLVLVHTHIHTHSLACHHKRARTHSHADSMTAQKTARYV